MRFELRYIKRKNKILRCAAVPLLAAILPLYLIEKAIINLESQWSWFPLAFLRGLLLHRKFHFERIYSTGGPASAHFAAGLLARCAKDTLDRGASGPDRVQGLDQEQNRPED